MRDVLTDIYDRALGGEPNLSTGERVASVALGLAAAAGGLQRGGALGLVMGIAGGALAMRGASGYCAMKAALQDRDASRQLTQDGRYPEGNF